MDFPAAQDTRKTKERQRTMKTERSGTGNLTKNQGASPLGRAKIARRVAMCLLAWLGFTGAGFGETIIWQEQFDDGNADSRWMSDTGQLWQMGSPTVGPATNSLGYRAHSGCCCATTGLNGNYLPKQNARLYSLPINNIVVPAANQNPRLRFWHWYSIQTGDSAIVEIKPVGSNTWTAISTNYNGTGKWKGGGGVWTRPSLDLSAYAGQTVQIAFHFTSDNVNDDVGWFVDDVALVTGTPVFNNPETFEEGLGDWAVDGGTWQVGSPTVGPPTNAVGGHAYSGTNCAATCLTGQYQIDVDSRLINLAAFVVPAASQSPRLRFWHWYSIQTGDSAIVEIKPVGSNTWTAISPNYNGTNVLKGGGGAWTRPSLDLSAYAGQTVQITFHFISNGDVNVDVGWFVDDVALVTGTPVFNNPETFEEGLGDWAVDGGTWQVGSPTVGPPTNAVGGHAYSGTNCAATCLTGHYQQNVDSRLISAPFTVPPSGASPALRFRNWYSFQSGDSGTVEIKPVGSSAWTGLTTNSGANDLWAYPSIPLTAYANQEVQIAFHFISNGDVNVDLGWFVDDVFIQSVHEPVIVTAPASQTNAVGTAATFNVSASGDLPLSYQWQFNSNSIAGATNTTLTLTNVQLWQSGYYDVVVTNAFGAVSTQALLQVVIAFTNIDIGDPGAPGGFTNSNGTYTVRGSGEGTDLSADVFNFTYQALAGDAQIVARLLSLQGGDPQLAEAGVMIRESLDPSSEQVSLWVNASTNVIFNRRLATPGKSIPNSFQGGNYLQGTNYIWLRLMRMGNTFIAHYSTNGLNWQYMWFTTVDMSNQVQVGLAVTAHFNGELATAVFDNVSIGSLTNLGTWPLPGPVSLLGGQNWSPAEFQRVGGFEFLLGGAVGDYFTIKGSTNVTTPVASWSQLATVTNIYGVVPFIDSQALTNPVRFYRAQRIGP